MFEIPTPSSPWLSDFAKQIVRGKHVLLYGNVADDFLFGGRYVTARTYLNEYFRQMGYRLICHYDVVDGIEFATPEMRAIFDQARRPAEVTAPPAEPERPFGGLAGAGALPGRAPNENRRGVRAPANLPAAPVQPMANVGPIPTQPDQAVGELRKVLRQSEVPTSVILDFSDKLVGDAERQTRDEIPILILLKKMVHEAAVLDSASAGNARYLRNSLIILAERLGGVPTWLYQGNPLLSVMQIPRPRREERQEFWLRNREKFRGGSELTGLEESKAAQQFIDLTDGLTTLDLQAVLRTSQRENISIAKPRFLIDYYKFGVKEDSPWTKLSADHVRSARRDLRQRVIGQEHAIDAVVDMLISARVGLRLGEAGKTGKPQGTFFFVGPTGVGKTELAKALALHIFGNEAALARFDMSEYAMEHAAEKLTGSPPGYIGYDAGGQLTNRVLERPFSLLLFDEIEKADGKIMDKFLQILEDGRLTDSRGQTADFSQSLIIFTSNIGSEDLDKLKRGSDGLPNREDVQTHYLTAVRQHFRSKLGRPELLNRLGDNILVFDMLRPAHIRGIVEKLQESLMLAARQTLGVTVQFAGEEVANLIRRLMQDPENLQMGGRRVRTLFEDVVLKELNRFIFENSSERGRVLTVCVPPQSSVVQIR